MRAAAVISKRRHGDNCLGRTRPADIRSSTPPRQVEQMRSAHVSRVRAPIATWPGSSRLFIARMSEKAQSPAYTREIRQHAETQPATPGAISDRIENAPRAHHLYVEPERPPGIRRRFWSIEHRIIRAPVPICLLRGATLRARPHKRQTSATVGERLLVGYRSLSRSARQQPKAREAEEDAKRRVNPAASTAFVWSASSIDEPSLKNTPLLGGGII